MTLGSVVSPFFTTISIDRAFFRNIVRSPVSICFSAAENKWSSQRIVGGENVNRERERDHSKCLEITEGSMMSH